MAASKNVDFVTALSNDLPKEFGIMARIALALYNTYRLSKNDWYEFLNILCTQYAGRATTTTIYLQHVLHKCDIDDLDLDRKFAQRFFISYLDLYKYDNEARYNGLYKAPKATEFVQYITTPLSAIFHFLEFDDIETIILPKLNAILKSCCAYVQDLQVSNEKDNGYNWFLRFGNMTESENHSLMNKLIIRKIFLLLISVFLYNMLSRMTTDNVRTCERLYLQCMCNGDAILAFALSFLVSRDIVLQGLRIMRENHKRCKQTVMCMGRFEESCNKLHPSCNMFLLRPRSEWNRADSIDIDVERKSIPRALKRPIQNKVYCQCPFNRVALNMLCAVRCIENYDILLRSELETALVKEWALENLKDRAVFAMICDDGIQFTELVIDQYYLRCGIILATCCQLLHVYLDNCFFD